MDDILQRMSEELERKNRKERDGARNRETPSESDFPSGVHKTNLNYVDSPVSLPERVYSEMRSVRRTREWERKGKRDVKGEEWGRGRGVRGGKHDFRRRNNSWYSERRSGRKGREYAEGERVRERIVRFDASTITEEQWRTLLPRNIREERCVMHNINHAHIMLLRFCVCDCEPVSVSLCVVCGALDW